MLSSINLKKLLAAVALSAVAGVYVIAAPGTRDAGAANDAPRAADQVVVALPDFTTLVEQYGNAVVNVRMERTTPAAARGPGPQNPNDPFFEFFRRFGPQQQPDQMPMSGQGSGFIIGSDGTILTNAHVVDGASSVVVKLNDRREFDAKVIGIDKQTDVAVLKIEASNLPTVRIGEPDRLKVGEWVIAIGSPFGLENTVTSGIVSAKARGLPDSNYVPFIQTDVAVNPGNSGGPLFNMKGEVVGINSQIFSRTGGYMGLSFAIPIDVAMNIKTQLVDNGKVTRGRIGVNIQDVNQALANSFGMPKPQGALISRVEPGGPADKAGLKSGDVILGINGVEISQLSQLPSRIAAITPGTDATLQIWRDGGQRDIEVKIGALDEQQNAAAAPATATDDGKLGLALRELTKAERESINAESGLVVEGADGAAARAGIKPGDVILALNNKPVKSVQELRDLVQKADGRTVALLIQRSEQRTYVPVEIG
jgi:serine protease Do